jgi:hypothetical protein
LLTTIVADPAFTIPVYPELIDRSKTVGFVSIVQFLVLVALKTTLSADVGKEFELQLLASDQLLVLPPPSQVIVAACA